MEILSDQGALARCVADGECLENLVCLQLCNGKPDESACQARQLGCRWRDTLFAVCSLLTPCGVEIISEPFNLWPFCYRGRFGNASARMRLN